MNDASELGSRPPPGQPRFRGDFSTDNYQEGLYTYLWGLALAVILTVLPFTLIYWHVMTAFSTVDRYCQLRTGPGRRSLPLLPARPPAARKLRFCAAHRVVILIMMAGGTVWILGNLHSRMY
jgi:heme/copper-type cytochrome/quinol oxidase subunit 4